MGAYLSIGEAAKLTGLSVSTMQRWELEGKYLPDYRMPGGKRSHRNKKKAKAQEAKAA